MERWKNEMQTGNRHFTAGRIDDALRCYQAGKQRAIQLFPVWFDRQQAVSALVISHHNIADLLVSRHRIAEAEVELRACYDFLYQVAACAPFPHEIDEALLQGMRRSYLQLLAYIQTYGSEDDMPPLFHQPFCPATASHAFTQ